MKPLLKWVGGKTQFLSDLLNHIPAFHTTSATYFEPFIGGGALYWYLADAYGFRFGRGLRAVIGDTNRHLVNYYEQIKTYPGEVQEVLARAQGRRTAGMLDRDLFFEARDVLNTPEGASLSARAAAFHLVNKLGFNGLWRVNKSGKCNVPPGKFKSPPQILSEDGFHHASVLLQATTVACQTFEHVEEQAKPGDVVYCDPPYVPASKTSDFTGYTEGGFGPADQERLMKVAYRMSQRGVHVVLSNSDTPEVRRLYSDDRFFTIHSVQARRSVNCKAGKRGKVGELIIVGRKP